MDDPISRSIIMWVVIGVCVILHFFFSLSETALSCCNRFKIQLKADEGKKAAKLVIKTCNKFDRALTTVLIGTNIVSIVGSMMAANVFYFYLKETGIDDFWISIIASIAFSLIIYIIGDALPKTIARAIPDTISVGTVYPIYALLWVFTYIIPITLLFEGLVKLMEKIFRVKEQADFTEEDFEDVVDKVTDEGVIEEEQSEIIQSALDFVDTNVKEVLTPREKIFALDIRELTHDKLKELISTTKYSRIPVYDTVFDNFIGVLHMRTYFKEITKNPKVSIRKILQKPYFVSGNIMIDDLFNGFKKHHTHLALVRGTDKKIIGMVTMEDVLEELVSDISEPAMKVRKK